MGFRDSVKTADARRQSEYVQPGRYLFEIIDFKEGANRKGREFVVVEMSVIASDNEERHPKGAERSWLQMTDTDVAAKNIRGFLCRALNVPDAALTDTMIDKAFEPKKATGKSPLASLRIGVNAREITTRRGNPFTVVDFHSVDQDAETLD
jgi:hypothetical protein